MEKFNKRIIINSFYKIEMFGKDCRTMFEIDKVKEQIDSLNSITGYSPTGDDKGVFYYQANEYVLKILEKTVPKELLDIGTVSICKINDGAVPHKDHDCKCKINFYLKTGDAKTIFFNDVDVQGHSYHADSRYNIFDLRKHRLKSKDSFTARDGETYLLNTSNIHAVTTINNYERIIISISFEKEFDEILSKLVH